MSYDKPLPAPDPETRPYWEAARDHRLLVQRCKSTGAYQFPPTTFCPGGFERPVWVEVSGRGTIFSWIVVRHPVPAAVYAADVPYAVALVELDEGIRIPANIVDCDVDAIVTGMPVEVAFRDVTPEISIPVFRPAN